MSILTINIDGMAGEDILCVPTIVDGAFILPSALGGTRVSTLGGARVSTLGGAGSPLLRSGYVCSTLGGATGLFRQA